MIKDMLIDGQLKKYIQYEEADKCKQNPFGMIVIELGDKDEN